MNKKDRSTEYMYISARIRAIEAKMPGKELIERMLAAADLGSAAAIAVESGILPSSDKASIPEELDSILLKRFKDALDIVEADDGGSQITPIIRTVYDCANIKAALRCVPNGIDFKDLIFDVGSLSAERYGEMALSGDFSELSENLCEAAKTAKEEYAATGDPLMIDIPLDRACFADMLSAAEKTGDGFVIGYVKAKIDMTNITIVLRILRMGENDLTMALLGESLLDGGNIESDELLDIIKSGMSPAEKKVKISEPVSEKYPSLAANLSEGDFENACDSFVAAMVGEARYIPFGAPVVLSFLSELEYEMKNIRIILAGKSAGLSPENIAERVRGSYV